MFPLMHSYFAKTICRKESSLIAIGAILPDLGTLMGLERKAAHEMGAGLLRFCEHRSPELLEFAIAYASHGIDPFGLDYYADEFWPQGEKGYCFQRAVFYKQRVQEACNLPAQWAVWKGHNFVEMSYELLMLEKDPYINDFLLRAVEDAEAVRIVAAVYHDFCGVAEEAVRQAVLKSRDIFCLKLVSPEHLALHYGRQLQSRHGITGVDLPQAAAIIADMQRDLRPEFVPFYQLVLAKVRQDLSLYAKLLSNNREKQ